MLSQGGEQLRGNGTFNGVQRYHLFLGNGIHDKGLGSQLVLLKGSKKLITLVQRAAQGGGEDEDGLFAVYAAVRLRLGDEIQQGELELVVRLFNGLKKNDGARMFLDKADKFTIQYFILYQMWGKEKVAAFRIAEAFHIDVLKGGVFGQELGQGAAKKDFAHARWA